MQESLLKLIGMVKDEYSHYHFVLLDLYIIISPISECFVNFLV